MKKIIEKISITIFDHIYKKQELRHKKRMEKLNKKILSGSICGEKFHSSSGATLSIKNNTEKNVNQEKIEKLITDNLDDPKKLFDFIKGADTTVYKIKNAQNILSKIAETEGFILPKKGLSALYLNLVLNKKIAFETSEIFVVSSFDVNPYAFIYQFYRWYCYKMKLEGYDSKTQEKFKHVFEICETNKINELDFDEILNLKSAIKRDIEAIDFVKKFVSNRKMAKKNLDKIKKGQTISV